MFRNKRKRTLGDRIVISYTGRGKKKAEVEVEVVQGTVKTVNVKTRDVKLTERKFVVEKKSDVSPSPSGGMPPSVRRHASIIVSGRILVPFRERQLVPGFFHLFSICPICRGFVRYSREYFPGYTYGNWSRKRKKQLTI